MDRCHGLTALVAEDDPAIQNVVRLILKRMGFEALLAGTGIAGLFRCQEADGDLALVVADIVMPEMGGFDTVNRIRAGWPEVPVLYVSGYPRFVDYLPDDPNALFVAKPSDLRRFLGRGRQAGPGMRQGRRCMAHRSPVKSLTLAIPALHVPIT